MICTPITQFDDYTNEYIRNNVEKKIRNLIKKKKNHSLSMHAGKARK